MAFDNRHSSTHSWTAPHVWGTAPPKSPTKATVSSFLGQEYTPSSPPSSRPSRSRSLTLRMNPFSSSNNNNSNNQQQQQQSAPAPLPSIDEESKKAYPTLNQVLNNESPPPYTLSSFMAYLSMMHSLETLEFLLDASRYRNVFKETFLSSNNSTPIQHSHPENERIKTMWQRLIEAYVRPGGSREVNLPGELRESLLRAPAYYTPPPPDLLDASINHVYNLMRDGILASFITNCNATSTPYQTTPIKSESSFTRNLWNKSPGGLLNRNNSGTSLGSMRSSSAEPPSTSQPISIPYPVSTPHRSSFPPLSNARSVGIFSPSAVTNLEDSHLDSCLDLTSDEMSDMDDGSAGRNSSNGSGRASPMTPPLTPPPQGEGSPSREGGMWTRKVRERFSKRRKI
jgi:Regulator of G protein signaling domain